MFKGRLFVIDVMPILYRGYFVFLKNPQRTATGINTSPVNLFASTLASIIKEFQPTHLALALESETPTFRHTLYPPYKAQRDKMPEEIGAAIPMALEIAQALEIPAIRADGFEADDVLGTLARIGSTANLETFIASPDKDLGQLVSDNVRLYVPGGKAEIRDAQKVCEQWGIQTPAQMLDYLALAGDSSDNIPGVPGIGDKTACKLLAQYHSFDQILAHAHEIPGKTGRAILENKELALLSKELVTIRCDVPLTQTLEDLRVKPFDPETLTRTLAKYELTQVARRFGLLTTTTPPPPPEEEKKYTRLPEWKHTYTLADTPQAISTLLQALDAAPLWAFDTETTGLNPRRDRAVGLSFATAPGRAWYVPLPEDETEITTFLAPFAPAFTNPFTIKIGHNLKFDRTVLRHYGFDLAGELRDTLLQHYLLDPTDRHSMDHIARTFLTYEPIPISTLIGEKKQGNMGDLPPQTILDYAAEDADVTLRLDAALRPKVKETGLLPLLETCEEPLASVLLDMEQEGVKIDTRALRQFGLELDQEIIALDSKIRDIIGGGINLSSPKQLGDVLFNELKLDPEAKKTATGQYATNEETLLRIRDRHPVIDLILDYRACLKLKNTYIDKLPTCIDPATGRIHTTFNQAFTETGRLSSADPNLQNIPIRTERGQRIREAFIPRDPSHRLISADYSQVELRLMAAMSRDPAMIEAFQRGADIHAETASRVYSVPLDQVTAQMRSHCKMVNFGIIYGISPFGLSQRLRIPRKEAADLIETYFTQYPLVKTYMTQTIETARQNGYAQTLFGRRRPLPDITSRNATTRAAAERIAINMPIQGTAADIIKFAMVRAHQELTRRNLKTKMILQIHDELLFDAPLQEIETVEKIIRKAMTTVIDLPIPLEIALGTGTNWFEAH